MRFLRLRQFPFLTMLAVSMLALGCKDLLVHENFARIRQNATMQAEVERIIGEPDHRLGELWRYDRPQKHLTVLIDCDRNGQVTRTQGIDAMTGVWEDSNESTSDRSAAQSGSIFSSED